MNSISLRLATPADAARLNDALRALSAALGDTHRATDGQIAAALVADGACRALIAESGAQVVGVAMFSPLFSTTRGMAGVYLSDLWVDDALRGMGLGSRLLAAVRDEAARTWGAQFLRLSVYAQNKQARAFYDRLGFTASENEHYLTLSGPALGAPKGEP